jgi:hypothetical protein
VRDDFSKQTIDQLAKRAGNVCSNPNCRKPTFGAARGHDGFVNVGVAGHITAAAAGGPRYDPNLTNDDRRHPSNGIWLCQTHGKLVDSDSEHFTVEKLREWKRVAEERSFLAIIVSGAAAHQQTEGTVPEALSDGLIDLESVTSRLIVAAKNDLTAFKRTPRWPHHAIALNLRMIHGESVQAFDALALSAAIETFIELSVIAPPGTGKTTTLLQVVEAILSRGNAVAAFVPLGEWSSETDSLLQSVAQRQAFVEEGEAGLKLLARSGRLVLLMDGWNELDLASRLRARGEIKKLKREFPGLAIVISTRSQALDVPISGPVVEIDTLTEYEQVKIARTLRGSEGEAILDHAWRTPGVRELIAIPLYLTALMAHTRGDRLPTTKEEVLRVFVVEQERDVEKAEMLRGAMFGFHSEMLTALAVAANYAGTTSLSDGRARAVVTRTEERLIAEGQITSVFQPMTVLDVLVSHHLLVRSGTDAAGISFQHQQFQEWYASFDVEALMRKAATGDDESRLKLRVGPLNIRTWEESVLFACERASRADDNGAKAVAAGILETIRIDPMLAAEMIYRSSSAVWDAIRGEVVEFVGRWHARGTVDRAVRFMITTGKPDFAQQIWPLILQQENQVFLRAFRAAHRFRPSVLGPDIEARVAQLPETQRASIASQIAHESDINGMEIAARIGAHDTSAKVKRSVIVALEFRRADRLAAEVLSAAPDEVWSVVAGKGYFRAIADPDAAARLARERELLIKTETDPLRKLRFLIDTGGRGTPVGREVAALIESADFPVKDQSAAWSIDEANKVYPGAVTTALLHRLQTGLEIPSRTADMLQTADIAIDDGPLVDFVMEDRKPRSVVVASMGILGPRTVGRLIDKLIAMKANLNKPERRADRDAAEQYQQLLGSISRTRPSSFVKAVLERSSAVAPEEIGLFAELISRHGKTDEGASLLIPSAPRADVIIVIADWAEVLLTSPSSSRSQLAEVATAIGRLSALELAPVLGRMLAEDLVRWRDAREKMRLAQERREKVDPAVRSSAQSGHTLQYRRAFAAIGGDYVVALMKSYLPQAGFDGFGVDAAQVLKEIWERERSSGGEKPIVFGTDFSRVKARRTERQKAPGGPSSPFADAIFTVIDDLIKPGSSDEDHRHALELANVALSMPYGDRARTLEALLQLPQSLREKQTLLSALVLAGEIVQADMLLDGIRGLLEQAKTKPWVLSDQNGWELESWLALLPFSDRPTATMDGLELVEGNRRQPWRLRGVLSALGYAPSRDAEGVLKSLARSDGEILRAHDWIGALEHHGPTTAARALLEFISEGAFSSVPGGEVWWLSRKLAGVIRTDKNFRAEVYRQYRLAPAGAGNEILEGAIAEGADEEGVLVLVRKHAAQGKLFSGNLEGAIRHAAVGERPSQDWTGVSELFGIAVTTLRRALFAMIDGDSAEGRLAKECLMAIDEIRDEYGPAESEPRHPDIESGRPWPVVAG